MGSILKSRRRHRKIGVDWKQGVISKRGKKGSKEKGKREENGLNSKIIHDEEVRKKERKKRI